MNNPNNRVFSAIPDPHTTDPLELARNGNPLSRTDLGLARRFAFYHGQDVVFVRDSGAWRVWDGRQWREDTHRVELKRRFADVAQRVKEEVFALPPSLPQGERTDYFRFALSVEQAGRIDNAIALLPACGGIARPLSDFDSDPLRLNVANGILDLRTGALEPHSRGAMMTRISDVEHHPGARDDLLNKFIGTATGGDPAFTEFLQRAAGYSLTGATGEKCLFLVYSEKTDTAKSTFLSALQTAAGGYSVTVAADLLLDSERDAPSYDLAKLCGGRLVIASETRANRRWKMELVKSLTGGDVLRAREIRQSSIEFRPCFKLWIATNHAPNVEGGGDEATWNRLRRLPFNHQVPRNERDPRIKAALEDPASPTARAFLAWAVSGAVAWASGGLGTCELIEQELEEYQRETDPIGAFLEDRCEIIPGISAPASAIRGAYDDWAKENGVRFTLSRNGFAAALRRHGSQECKGTGGVRQWSGIRLLVA